MIKAKPFQITDTASEYALFDPLLRPFVGVASKPDLSALPEGAWGKCGGFRRDQEILRARDGSVRLTTNALISGGSPRGLYDVRLNGTNYIIAAAASGGKIRLFYSTDYGATFTEFSNDGATGADDKYGETRMTDGGIFVEFEKFTDRYLSRDLLIIQNGVDSPRIWDPLASDVAAPNSCKTAIHRTIPLPSALGRFSVVWRFYDTVEVNNSQCSPTGTGADVTAVNSGTYPDMFVRATFTTACASGDSFSYGFVSNLYFETPAHSGTGIRARQFGLLIDCSDRDILSKVKITLLDGATTKVIHNGYSAIYPFVEEPFDRVSNKRFVAWDLTELGWTRVTNVTIEWIATTSPTASIVFDTLGIFASGCIAPGSNDQSAEFGCAFYHSGSRAHSPGIVLPNRFTQPLANDGFTSLDGAVIPQRQALFYYPTVQFMMPSQAEIDKGTDYLHIFLRDADGIRHFLIGAIQIASYSGGAWSDYGSFTVSTKETTKDFNPTIANLSTYRNEKVELPKSLHRTIPIGKAMLNANGRLFIAAKPDNSTAMSLGWISERNNPTRFLYIPDAADDYSANYNTFDGEDICRIIAQPSGNTGESSVFIVTDQNTHLLNGFGASLSHPICISHTGSRSPRSFAFDRNEWFFVDDTMRVRRVGNFEDLSRHSWDDTFQAIPAARKAFISSCCHLDRVYFGYTIAAGTTNTRALVFNTERRDWEANDPLPTSGGLTAEQFLSVWDGTDCRRKLIAVGSDCHIYEFEKPGLTTDVGNGSGVLVELRTRSIHFGMTQYLTAKRVRIVGSSFSSSLTIVRTYDPGSGTGTSSLSFAPKVAETLISRFDGAIVGSGNQYGFHVYIDISGTMLGGKLIKGIYVELQENSLVGDA